MEQLMNLANLAFGLMFFFLFILCFTLGVGVWNYLFVRSHKSLIPWRKSRIDPKTGFTIWPGTIGGGIIDNCQSQPLPKDASGAILTGQPEIGDDGFPFVKYE